MGIAFCVITAEANFSEIQKICQKHGTKTHKIGNISSEKGVVIQKENKKIKLI